MNAKSLWTSTLLAFVAVSIGYLVISELKTTDAGGDATPALVTPPNLQETEVPESGRESRGVAGKNTAKNTLPTQPDHKVIVYYFHNTQRCMTCNKIERLAEEALREQFAAALRNGELEWHVVNMEEPPNTHFIEDYQLVASSLVLIDMHDGKQRNWTNMEKVWQYVHDDNVQFKQYVAEQVREYLES
ncbi:MAG: hypothetical protein DHS20C16_22130 [Phycisphaerae bacterium]|nr:MAG: hypothetical protein DHS20C16_22130 [Phycisphaerae bacterium]